MVDLYLPDGFEDMSTWEKIEVLEERGAKKLRKEINDIVGLSDDDINENVPLTFKKRNASKIILALGGPLCSEGDGKNGKD